VVELHYQRSTTAEIVEIEAEYLPLPSNRGKFLRRLVAYYPDGTTAKKEQFFRWQDGSLESELVIDSDGGITSTIYEADGKTVKSTSHTFPIPMEAFQQE